MRWLVLPFFTVYFSLNNFVRIYNDIVVSSTVTPIWTSMVFMIPVDYIDNHQWRMCKKYSNYYCLVSFITDDSSMYHRLSTKGVLLFFKQKTEKKLPVLVRQNPCTKQKFYTFLDIVVSKHALRNN